MSDNINKKVFLDLGCGNRKKDGYLGIDRYYFKGVDLVADIDKGLPLKENTIDGVHAKWFLEHISNLIFVFQEIYRVCRNGARVEILVPYFASTNAVHDPTHKQFFTEETFKYFSKNANYGSDYHINTDFKIIKIEYGYANLIKYLPFKRYLRRYLYNVVGTLSVMLEVVK